MAMMIYRQHSFAIIKHTPRRSRASFCQTATAMLTLDDDRACQAGHFTQSRVSRADERGGLESFILKLLRAIDTASVRISLSERF